MRISHDFDVFVTLGQGLDIVYVFLQQILVLSRGIFLAVLLILPELLHCLLVLGISEPELVLKVLDNLIVGAKAAIIPILFLFLLVRRLLLLCSLLMANTVESCTATSPFFIDCT